MASATVRTWHGEVACGFALTIAGGLFAHGGRAMSLFEDTVPGPGLVPAIAGVLLAGLGLFIAAGGIVRRDATPVIVFDRDSLLAALLLLAAVVAFEPLGFAISTFAFLWAAFVFVGGANTIRAGIVALFTTAVTWVVFVKALGVGLPTGWLGI